MNEITVVITQADANTLIAAVAQGLGVGLGIIASVLKWG